jgi:hypothetical protein
MPNPNRAKNDHLKILIFTTAPQLPAQLNALPEEVVTGVAFYGERNAFTKFTEELSSLLTGSDVMYTVNWTQFFESIAHGQPVKVALPEPTAEEKKAEEKEDEDEKGGEKGEDEDNEDDENEKGKGKGKRSPSVESDSSPPKAKPKPRPKASKDKDTEDSDIESFQARVRRSKG